MQGHIGSVGCRQAAENVTPLCVSASGGRKQRLERSRRDAQNHRKHFAEKSLKVERVAGLLLQLIALRWKLFKMISAKETWRKRNLFVKMYIIFTENLFK